MRILSHIGTGHDIIRHFVEEAGHTIKFITHWKDAYQERMDRLILLGGRDISPFLYGQPIVDAQPPDQTRDKVEWVLARRAISEDIPVMGICRGCQMLSIAHGCSLHQDIYMNLGLVHENGKSIKHRINVTGPLADHIPTRLVNSLHHQAINKVHGIDIAATSTDGIIEAIYRPGALGVQWHPELLLPTQPKWATLFNWWIDGLD